MRIGLGIGLNRFRGGQAAGPVNTVAPEITGTAERGEELSSTTGTWTGTGTITYAYQWRRNGAPIAGATSNTYTLVAADDNATITCIVTATDDTGSRAASSNAVGPVLGAPFNLAAPVLTGTETVGQTLSVTTGTWQGVATITYAYQWRRDGSNISGATSSTYTLVAADYDAVIDCVVTATNSLDSASADSNDTGAIAGLAPTNDVAPSISGSTGLGDVLTRVEGTWSGVPAPTLAGQWRRNGVAIPGETGATYTIVAADSGAAIDYLETATNAIGSASADSNNITVQTFAAPTNDVAPSISGNTGLGDTLTRTAGTWSGNPTPSLTGQWLRNGSPIAGETGTTYTIVLADDNAEITYRETATNAIGSAQATSLATQIDDFTAPTNDVAPSITGDDPATIGDVLTRVQGTWSGNPTPTLAGEWYRNNVGTGETGSTYTITAADDNSFIFYRETATNAIGSASEDSAAVTVEDFTVPAITGVPTIAGTEEVGETLTATAAAATGNPAPTTTWQWQRSSDGSSGWANISGATSATYTLVAADETNYIRVQQIETNVLGSDTAVSASTGEITAPATGGLLDSYTGAAAAFSLDTLIYSSHSVVDTKTGSETYNDPAAPYTVLVRRDTTPNAWRSFTHTEVGDGTLTTWVGAGNNGFVEVWYNQGSAGDAEQTTTASQPKIVDNGSLVVENAKAALFFDGVDDFLIHNSMPFSAGEFAIFSVARFAKTSRSSIFDAASNISFSISNGFRFDNYNSNLRVGSNQTFTSFANSSTDLKSYSATINANSRKVYIDAVNVATQNGDNRATWTSVTQFKIGAVTSTNNDQNSGFNFLDGVLCFLIAYNSDQSANQTAIETAINNYYQIY